MQPSALLDHFNDLRSYLVYVCIFLIEEMLRMYNADSLRVVGKSLPCRAFCLTAIRKKSTEAFEKLGETTSDAPELTKRRMTIMENVQKAKYIHHRNDFAEWWYLMTTFRWYWFAFLLVYSLSHVIFRFRSGQKKSAETAMIGENLLDETCKTLLAEIEKIREKDPVRLEKEANEFHELFWKQRAFAVTDEIKQRRAREAAEESVLLSSSGTDMSEWVEAKSKDRKEKDVARRTRDYINGFHKHLKTKRLI